MGVNEGMDVLLCSLEMPSSGTQALGRNSASPFCVCLMDELGKGHSNETEHPRGLLVERVLQSTHHPGPVTNGLYPRSYLSQLLTFSLRTKLLGGKKPDGGGPRN